MAWAWLGGGLVALATLLYWQLIIAEGAYLGRKVVSFLYDLHANDYDRIKGFNPQSERRLLAEPLTHALAQIPRPLLLDVATGTARLPRALLALPTFRGEIVGLDYSRQMLREAVRRTATWKERCTWVWHGASQLPFPANSFDAVSSLEALEFMPVPEQVLTEMVRVLRPGGVFLISNRVGRHAAWLPGRSYQPQEFEELLRAHGLEMVHTQRWLVDYDLLWAVKPGLWRQPRAASGVETLRCPRCAQELRAEKEQLVCPQEHHFPIGADGVLELVRK